MKPTDRKEDAKNLSIITAMAVAAVVITAGLRAGDAGLDGHDFRHRVRTVDVAPVLATSHEPFVISTPLSGTNRIYGSVLTDDGEELTGFIRWDRNEGSWADLLDAAKNSRRSTTLSAIRFGHVQTIDVLGRDAALFTLKSGDKIELGAHSTDLGSGLRALRVENPDGMTTELEWDDLERIEFTSPPADAEPENGRLYGTLRLSNGAEFTGHVTWDVDEIYSNDVLDGDEGRDRQKIPFGAIASIARNGSGSARVSLHNGDEMILRGTNDVDHSNSGISVSDAALGQVLVEWSAFDEVRFHGTDSEVTYDDFDGGDRIRGVVVTEDGREASGEITWDNDESFTWEMLNGELTGDVELQIEFSRIARIDKSGRGARVELLDGRVFELSGSNDVDDGNRGIVIDADGERVVVDWDDFVSLTLNR